MSINLTVPPATELKPKIMVIGVGGAGGNAVNNMIDSQLEGVDFLVSNTDAQALANSRCDRRIQLGVNSTQGLGAGSRPDVGRAAAEEALDMIVQEFHGCHMAFITAGMGGGTGTGAAPIIARAARDMGILTVGVVTKPFQFEGAHRMAIAESGIAELQDVVDTLIIIPNQNLFRIANEKTTFADAFKMADDVLHSGVRGVTDLMVMPGLINLDFADVKTVMSEMGKAMMGTGEAEGEKRAIEAAEAAISNPLLDDVSMKGANGVLINITGGMDLTLFEVDEAANRIRSEVDPDANIIVGSTFDDTMAGSMRVSVVATGIDAAEAAQPRPVSLVGGLRTMASSVPAPAMAEERPASRPNLDIVASQPAPTGGVVAGRPEVEEEEAATVVAAAEAEPRVAVGGGAGFIPPRPAEPPQRPVTLRASQPVGTVNDAPAPAAAPAPAPAPTGAAPRRRPFGISLFERVTGGRASQETPAAVRSTPHRAEDRPVAARPAADAAIVRSEPRATPAASPSPQVSSAASRQEEDLLEIPAFLRRQAN